MQTTPIGFGGPAAGRGPRDTKEPVGAAAEIEALLVRRPRSARMAA